MKEKKLMGPTTAKNPVQRFNAASVSIARLLLSRASIARLRSAFDDATGELAPASAAPTRVQLQEEYETEQLRRETVERAARRLKEKLAQAENMLEEEAQAQIRAAAEKMAARLASAKVKKAEKEAEKEKKAAAKSVAAADEALIDGLIKAGNQTARARKRARGLEGKAGKSEKRFQDLQDVRNANEQLRDEKEQVRTAQPSTRAPRAGTSKLTAPALPVRSSRRTTSSWSRKSQLSPSRACRRRCSMRSRADAATMGAGARTRGSCAC
jgi:hypothetical protein